MSAPLKISDELAARVQQMCALPCPDAVAFETGEAHTLAARSPQRQMILPGIPLPELAPKRMGPASRFPNRRPQRSPDKQASYDRRHRRAYSGVLPPQLAARLTVGDMAVLCVIANEYRGAGRCELPLDKIAALAGVCRKTAGRAMHKARDQNLISIEDRPVSGKKHLPNLVRVTSFEWLKWLRSKVGRSEPIGGHLLSPTNNTSNDDGGGRNSQTAAGATADPPQGGLPSKEASDFSDELANISGHRRASVPKSWQEANPPQVVQVWMNSLAEAGVRRPIDMLRILTIGVMRRKRDSKPPFSPRYFSAEVRKLVDEAKECRARIAAGKVQRWKCVA